MMNRRHALLLTLAATGGTRVTEASAQPYDANGLDRRTLENIERGWIKSRFLMDQAMEENRLNSRNIWPNSKQKMVRGSFNLGYRETGKAEVIENGVRTGRIA